MIEWNIPCGCAEAQGAKPAEPDKWLRLVFLRSQLLYDIANTSWALGDALPAESGHAKHLVQDIANEQNADRAGRVMELCTAAAAEMLFPYSKYAQGDFEQRDDRGGIPERYVIDLHVPPCFSRGTGRLLESLVHEYIVARVIAEWLKVCGSAAWQVWMQTAQGHAQEISAIKDEMKARQFSGRLRRPCKPF